MTPKTTAGLGLAALFTLAVAAGTIERADAAEPHFTAQHTIVGGITAACTPGDNWTANPANVTVDNGGNSYRVTWSPNLGADGLWHIPKTVDSFYATITVDRFSDGHAPISRPYGIDKPTDCPAPPTMPTTPTTIIDVPVTTVPGVPTSILPPPIESTTTTVPPMTTIAPPTTPPPVSSAATTAPAPTPTPTATIVASAGAVHHVDALPATGANPVWTAVIGLAFIPLGLSAVFASRRRRTGEAS